MKEIVAKIALYIIYFGIAISLALPLFVDSDFFFPFITTRAFIFRTVVAFMLLGFLALMATKHDIRTRIGGVTGQFLGLFVLIAFVASLLGPNFYNSFWGDMERSEGLLLWLNLLAFFIIAVSVVRTEKNWLRLFDVSLGVAFLVALFGLGQYLGLESILNSGGSRVESTFGNAAFLAAYLIFHVAIAAILFVKRKFKEVSINKEVILGLIITVIGGLVTIVSYAITDPGGEYFIFYGLILFGLYKFINGLKNARKSSNKTMQLLKGYYIAAALLFTWIIVATQTRGAVLGLAAGLFITSLLALWHYRGNATVKRLGVGTLLFVIVISGFIYFARNTSFAKDSILLQRLASISTTTRTAETRLLTWGAAWDGWKDNFLLGVGLENFNVIFNKNFPPRIYEDEGSVVWFDRAHNFIFDRATTTGILGLLTYLGFIIYPVYALWKKTKENQATVPLAIVASGLTAAFLIQNLFVFENITTYPILIFTWAFLADSASPPREEGIEGRLDSEKPKSSAHALAYSTAAVAFAVAIIPMLWITTWKPAQTNRVVALGMQERQGEQETFSEFFEKMKEGIDAETYGNPEYRLNFIEHVSITLGNRGEVLEAAKPYLEYTELQIDNLIEKNPNDAKNYLLAMRFYNDTRGALPGQEVQRLEIALSYYPRLQELSPTRPHVPQEVGYTYRYLMLGYMRTGETIKAQKAYGEAEDHFRQAIELQPQVVVSYTNLIRIYQEFGEDTRIQEVVNLMEERAVAYKSPRYLANMLAISKSNESLPWIEFFALKLTEVDSQNFNGWIDLALAYAYQDKRQEAIDAANKIKEFGGDFVAQADAFIEQVNTGFYLENPI